MLTSKEIIERTGISRATLNNYIGSGLVPRPQVLPPGPDDGVAPRIGYFPDDTIERIEAIQRLKREGWSISRIAAHLAAHPPVAAGPAAHAPIAQAAMASGAPAPIAAAPAAPAAASLPASPGLSLEEGVHPAYLVDARFRIVWVGDAAGLSPLPVSAARHGNVFEHLLRATDDAERDALLRFHLQAAKARGVLVSALLADLSTEQAGRLERLFRELHASDHLVTHAALPATASAGVVYAVQFREGVLFAYAPAAREERRVEQETGRAAAAPQLTAVAVLAGTLQDAAGLWVRLTAQEYFELVNEVWAELDAIFRRHHGRTGRHADDIVACYFLPQSNGSYLVNALAAAQDTREAMRQVSRRWQARKGWDIELAMNLGIAEGEDWMGSLGTSNPPEVRVLGDAADRADQLSACSRLGAVLVTRSLLGKLAPQELQRLHYGMPRLQGAGHEPRLLSTFARLGDIATPVSVPARFADLAVAELLDPNFPANPARNGAG